MAFNDTAFGTSLAAITEPDGNTVGAYAKDMWGNLEDKNVLEKALSGSGKEAHSNDPNKAAASNVLGGGFYSSAPHIAAQYSQLGKFFSGTEPGNFYTNRYEKPQPTATTASTKPSDFYAHWYMAMRELAQSAEIADRGQSQIRSV